jgi:hypothetical protein
VILEPGDGVYGFQRSLAHTIEPRTPIGKLGFTEGYPLLEIGENGKERVSMHAAQYTTTPISWTLIAPATPPPRPRGLGDLSARLSWHRNWHPTPGAPTTQSSETRN